MKVLIIRDIHGVVSTQGRMYVDNKFFGYTLEDKLRPAGVKVKGKTCIQAGLYLLSYNYSKKFRRYMPLIVDTPMFRGVRIHEGNNANHTEGCILLGAKKGEKGIYECSLINSNLRAMLADDIKLGKRCEILIIDYDYELHMYPEWLPDSYMFNSVYP